MANNDLKDFDPILRPALENSLEAMDVLDEVVKNDAARITETVFKAKLLPVLANRDGKQSLGIWQDIAGNVLRPIIVLDDATGNVLFKVPAILRSINREFTGKGMNSASEIVATAQAKRNVMPAMADRHITENITNKITHTPVNSEDVLAWNEILVRYGYEPLFDYKAATKDTDVVTKVAPEVEGYDDF